MTIIYMKKTVLFLSLPLALLFFSGCGKSSNSTAVDENSPIIFFYGQECPHCQLVEKFIEDNKVGDKVNFSQAEVYHNAASAEIMKKKADLCQIAPQGMGVPFLWAEGKCYIGDQDIIQFFKDKMNASQ